MTGAYKKLEPIDFYNRMLKDFSGKKNLYTVIGGIGYYYQLFSGDKGIFLWREGDGTYQTLKRISVDELKQCFKTTIRKEKIKKLKEKING